MSFDQAYKAEAERMFERVSKLERTVDGGKTWTVLAWGQIAEDVYSDKSHSSELASPHGVRMTDGSAVRFVLPITQGLWIG